LLGAAWSPSIGRNGLNRDISISCRRTAGSRSTWQT